MGAQSLGSCVTKQETSEQTLLTNVSLMAVQHNRESGHDFKKVLRKFMINVFSCFLLKNTL